MGEDTWTARGERTWRARSLVLACVAWLAPAALAGGEKVWLEVDRPHDGWVELGLSPLLQVRGSAGTLGRGKLDLVVIVDVSRSTGAGSGVDVNGDGHLGGIGWRHRRDWRSFVRHPQTSSDPEDSILRAEVEAVRRLLDRLDPDRTRLGVVTLAGHALVRSSVWNTRAELLQALDFLEQEQPRGRTNMAQAIRVATEALEMAAAHGGAHRESAVILLSDGHPTAPGTEAKAARLAVQAALEAWRKGVRIYAIALGVRDADSTTLREIADVARGSYTSLSEPGEIIDALPRLDLRGFADVRIENKTTRKPARAVRVWADGTFDGFVELREGKNRLIVAASSAGGAQKTMERTVYFRKRQPRNPKERRLANQKLEQLRDVLRDRRLEVTIARELDAARQQLERSLTIQLED